MFDLIPDDAIGIISYDNDDPLQQLPEGTFRTKVRIVERGVNYLKMESNIAHAYSGNFYLGVIRNIAAEKNYWVNDTKPLP